MSIDPFRVQVQGPLAPFAAGFASELARQGYTRLSARNQMWLLAHLSRWLASEGIDVKDLDAGEVDRFVRARCGYWQLHSIKALRPIFTYLHTLGVVLPSPRVPDDPVDVLLERYRRYLTVERSLGDATAVAYAGKVRPFLRHRLSPDGRALDLAGLAATDIVAFVVAHCPQMSRGAAGLTVTALRSLLAFLHVEGLVAQSLAACVPSVRSRRLAGLPKGLDEDQVRRLLTTCDRSTSLGRRDFAVLSMLVRLGLRGEKSPSSSLTTWIGGPARSSCGAKEAVLNAFPCRPTSAKQWRPTCATAVPGPSRAGRCSCASRRPIALSPTAV